MFYCNFLVYNITDKEFFEAIKIFLSQTCYPISLLIKEPLLYNFMTKSQSMYCEQILLKQKFEDKLKQAYNKIRELPSIRGVEIDDKINNYFINKIEEILFLKQELII